MKPLFLKASFAIKRKTEFHRFSNFIGNLKGSRGKRTYYVQVIPRAYVESKISAKILAAIINQTKDSSSDFDPAQVASLGCGSSRRSTEGEVKGPVVRSSVSAGVASANKCLYFPHLSSPENYRTTTSVLFSMFT